MRRTGVAVLMLTATAFGLRLVYLLHSHPFIDEFTTILATRSILELGLPVLPSGLFYEHGLLFSYVGVPFVAVAGEKSLFALARMPSLLIGTAPVPLIYWVGRRWLSPLAGLVAATLLAFSPEGIVWGGRARMYALAQLLVLLVCFLVYEGSLGEGRSQRHIAPRRSRWLALLVLLALLLTQFGALVLVPPLFLGAIVIGWITCPEGARPWFARRAALIEGLGLALVVGFGLWVKRLGRPLGVAPLGSDSAGGLIDELVGTISYQAGLVLDGESTVKFLARQFGVPHHLWLTLVAVVGGGLTFAVWLSARKSMARQANPPRGPRWADPYSFLFIWLVFGLTLVEMVVLLEPWRRNPRYLIMALPLFYLIVGGSVDQIVTLMLRDRGARESGNLGYLIPVLVFIIAQAVLLVPDLHVAYRTPEPAYEEAFWYVADHLERGDLLLTMNTSGAGLLLADTGHTSAELAFGIQDDATQFLLDADTQPVDRWLGAPWIGTAADFNRVLNEHRRTWFVVDNIRLPVYYRGDWLAILDSQMDLVWSEDDALVYLTRPNRIPVPPGPDVSLEARFGELIALKGYSIGRKGDVKPETQDSDCEAGRTLCMQAGDTLQITFFWEALAPIDRDYTVFLHVRNENGENVSQRDGQPFDGLYPTSRWHPGETVALPFDVDLPLDLSAGSYYLSVGFYRLDTMTRLPLEDDSTEDDAFIVDDTILVVSGDQ